MSIILLKPFEINFARIADRLGRAPGPSSEPAGAMGKFRFHCYLRMLNTIRIKLTEVNVAENS